MPNFKKVKIKKEPGTELNFKKPKIKTEPLTEPISVKNIKIEPSEITYRVAKSKKSPKSKKEVIPTINLEEEFYCRSTRGTRGRGTKETLFSLEDMGFKS